MTQSLPESFAEFGEARQKGFLRVKEIKEQGGKVAGVFCTFTPLEILDAARLISVSLCGMSAEHPYAKKCGGRSCGGKADPSA